ncbi:unnamed protein product [Effrenium voratum]|nr:unnamed protein product [Effrenium voratum]
MSESKATEESPSLELDEYLEDTSCWKSFDDVEDEVHYLRHRGDVLAGGLKAARQELLRLHDAGHRLQQAYEDLHRQFREVAADAVYWQSLAEASRVPESPAMPKSAIVPAPTPVEETSPSNAREALRRAAVEAAKALQQKSKLKEAAGQGKENVSMQFSSPSKDKGRDLETLTRTPPRRLGFEEESPSPCPSVRSMPSLSGSRRKWGIGSSPKRCPKLGTPTRRAQAETELLRSPGAKAVFERHSPRLGRPEALWAKPVPKLPRRSEGMR